MKEKMALRKKGERYLRSNQEETQCVKNKDRYLLTGKRRTNEMNKYLGEIID